jgi:hypothetical protein
VRGGKHVETADGVGHHVHNEQSGETLERETVNAGTEAFLHCADGALDLADMAVGGHDVNVCGVQIGTDALKLVVCVHITNPETATSVQLDDGEHFLEHGGMCAVGDGTHGAELKVTSNGMEENMSLHKEKIHAEDYIAVVLEHRRRQRDSFECGNTGSNSRAGGFTLEDCNVGTVNRDGSLGIKGGDGTIANGPVSQDALELSLAWATDEAVQLTGMVRLHNIATCE